MQCLYQEREEGAGGGGWRGRGRGRRGRGGEGEEGEEGGGRGGGGNWHVKYLLRSGYSLDSVYKTSLGVVQTLLDPLKIPLTNGKTHGLGGG